MNYRDEFVGWGWGEEGRIRFSRQVNERARKSARGSWRGRWV